MDRQAHIAKHLAAAQDFFNTTMQRYAHDEGVKVCHAPLPVNDAVLQLHAGFKTFLSGLAAKGHDVGVWLEGSKAPVPLSPAVLATCYSPVAGVSVTVRPGESLADAR